VIVFPNVSIEPATAAAAPSTVPSSTAPTTGPNRLGFGRGPRTVTIGKEVNDASSMILFSPAVRDSDNTDPSYHLPAFYELWARWGPPEDRDFWLRAARASRDLFINAAHPRTGLIPNRTGFDGTPWRIAGQFREDAWRCAMNYSVDWSWFAKDPRQPQLADRLQAFFESRGMETYDDNWTLDGTPLRHRHSPGLLATNAVASLAATDASRRTAFVQALWNADVPSSLAFRYYDGLLYMMCLMHCSGDFRAIMPGRP
jgi:oligosaccharide reducing-end xylanase